MKKRFLLLYEFENLEGMNERKFEWYETETDMLEYIADAKTYLTDFTVGMAMEIYDSRIIEASKGFELYVIGLE